ncbi:MAG: hypothetical protein ACEPOV_08545 [Hyphomicrobiales bacterium]
MKKKELSIKKETIAKLELKGDIMGGYTGYKSCNLCLVTQHPNCESQPLYCPSEHCFSDHCNDIEIPTKCSKCL